jgi:hypothetical protein
VRKKTTRDTIRPWQVIQRERYAKEDRLLREHEQQQKEYEAAVVEKNDLNEPNEAPTVVQTNLSNKTLTMADSANKVALCQ